MKVHFREDFTGLKGQDIGMSRVACGWKNWKWKYTTRWKKNVTCKKCKATKVYKKYNYSSEKKEGN